MFKNITFISLFIFSLFVSNQSFAYRAVVEKTVTKEHGGIGGLFNLYSDIYSDMYVDSNGGKHITLICKYHGWQRCKVSNVYNNPYTGELFEESINNIIDENCEMFIESSEKEFVNTGTEEGSNSKLIGIKNSNGEVIYYLSFLANWSYQMIDETEFNGNVYIIVNMILPEELN
jgi:hypothetical protein